MPEHILFRLFSLLNTFTMRYAFILAGMATMVASQALDLEMIDNAPAPVATGPAVTAIIETVSYSPAAAGSAAVTGTAAAEAQVVRRGLIEARTFGSTNILCAWFGWYCPTTVKPQPTAAPAVTTPAASQTTPPASRSSTSSSAPSSITSINTIKPTPTGIPSSCTNTWTNTFEFTSATDCPQIYEVGTYCGFVNPEDPCADQPKGTFSVQHPDLDI